MRVPRVREHHYPVAHFDQLGGQHSEFSSQNLHKSNEFETPLDL